MREIDYEPKINYIISQLKPRFIKGNILWRQEHYYGEFVYTLCIDLNQFRLYISLSEECLSVKTPSEIVEGIIATVKAEILSHYIKSI